MNACRQHGQPVKALCVVCHPPRYTTAEQLAQWFLWFLGTAHSVEEYVSPGGYRFKKVTR